MVPGYKSKVNMAKKGIKWTFVGPVSFFSVGIESKFTRIGVQFDRANMELDEADALLTDGELHISMERDQEQIYIEGLEPDIFEGRATCTGFRVGGSHISASFSFSKTTIAIDQLSRFAKIRGVLRAVRVGTIEGRGEPAEEDPDQLRLVDAGAVKAQ